MRVPINQVSINPHSLRSVDHKDPNYLDVYNAVKERGFCSAVTVHQIGENQYELIDGLHRYTACMENGLKDIEITCVEVAGDTPDEKLYNILTMQVMLNASKVETKPMQYLTQIKHIMALKQDRLTVAELAQQFGKSVQWINDRLSLDHIKDEEIKKLIDTGHISLANAYTLSKLPEEDQVEFKDRAIVEPNNTFMAQVKERLAQVNAAKRAGRVPNTGTFEAPAHLRTVAVLKSEAESVNNYNEYVAANGEPTTPKDAWLAAIKWTLHLDPQSVKLAKEKHDAAKANAERAKTEKKAEAAKKALEAEQAKLANLK